MLRCVSISRFSGLEICSPSQKTQSVQTVDFWEKPRQPSFMSGAMNEYPSWCVCSPAGWWFLTDTIDLTHRPHSLQAEGSRWAQAYCWAGLSLSSENHRGQWQKPCISKCEGGLYVLLSNVTSHPTFPQWGWGALCHHLIWCSVWRELIIIPYFIY